MMKVPSFFVRQAIGKIGKVDFQIQLVRLAFGGKVHLCPGSVKNVTTYFRCAKLERNNRQYMDTFIKRGFIGMNILLEIWNSRLV